MIPSTTTRTTPCFSISHREGYEFDAVRRCWIRSVDNSDNMVWCRDCHSWKAIDSFANIKGRPYSYCKPCQRIHKAMSRYGLSRDSVMSLYEKSACECCCKVFATQQEKHIHHIGSVVRGLLCRECNHLIRDESSEHKQRLKAILVFMGEDIV